MPLKIEDTRTLDSPFSLAGLVEEAPDSIVSRAVMKSPAGNVTLFSFAVGEELSAHTAPYDAFVYVLKGRAGIVIGDKKHAVSEGEGIVMPANVRHAVYAEEAFKMLLVMIKG
ncbi:MAG: cupin domain-containing protein [Pseudomonadota bacterium]